MAPKDTKTNSLVYIKDPEYGWRPAVLENLDGDKATVRAPEYANEHKMVSDGGRTATSKGEQKVIDLKKYAHNVLPLQNVDAEGMLIEFPDMVKLPYLHEVSLHRNDPGHFKI
jgi:hypothetical protein